MKKQLLQSRKLLPALVALTFLAAFMPGHAQTTDCRNLSPLTLAQIIVVRSVTRANDGSYTYRLAANTSNKVIISCGQGCSSYPNNVDMITYFPDLSVNVKQIIAQDSCGLTVKVIPNDPNQPFKVYLRVRFRRQKNNGQFVLERRRGYLHSPTPTSPQPLVEDSPDDQP